MKIYKPLIDRVYITMMVIIFAVLTVMTVISAFSTIALLIVLPIYLLVVYHIISPFFGYVELRDETLYVRYGLFIKREVPYSKIRNVNKGRGFYSESMLSLKCAIEHVNIKYNAFDMTTVSVVDNDTFISELNKKI